MSINVLSNERFAGFPVSGYLKQPGTHEEPPFYSGSYIYALPAVTNLEMR